MDNTAAVNSSPDWTEASSGRRRSGRRPSTAVTPRDSLGSRSGTQRVLRARAVAAPDGGNDSLDTPRNKNPTNVQHCVGRAAASRSRKAPVTRAEKKKPRASKISKQDVGPKTSKSRRDKRSKSAITTFKSETETAASACGEDVHDAEGIKENGKSRRGASLSPTEVKKEEEEEEKGTEKEGSTQAAVQIEDGAGDNAETSRKRSRRHEKAPRQPKRRKKPPVQYVRCEMEGCGTILAHPRYLQHHIKYQHLLKKKYVCDHPSCGRLFRLQKQLLRHAKHHTDQRDYICEYCARAFKSSYNLAVHRMIHTGEKPIQCEICGFTCRQKASLNWHMKKHDVEGSYQFSCSICGKKFEKKDSVVAHKAKIHPKVLIAEAMAANGGSVIRTSAPVIGQPEHLSISQKSPEQQNVTDGMLTPLQQVALPPVTQAQVDVTPDQFLQLVARPQQAPALLHLAAAPPAHFYPGPPQLIQLSSLPSSTVTSTDSQSTLLTLSSVGSLAPPHVAHWDGTAHSDTQTPGEGELWDRVVVGEDIRHAEEVIWEGNEVRRKENDSIVWEQEGERHILLQCAEVSADNLM